MKKLLNNKAVIFYSALCLIFLGAIITQFILYYSAPDTNAKNALKSNQRFVIDIDKITFHGADKVAKDQKKPIGDKLLLPENAPKISVIITNLGDNKDVMDAAFRLPREFAVSFSPYTIYLYEQSQIASTLGHQVMIDLPLEVPGKNMGKFEITSKNSAFRNLQNIEAIFSKPKNVKAVITPEKEIFTSSESLKLLLDILSDKKIGIIYSGDKQDLVFTEAKSSGVKIAGSNGSLVNIEKLSEIEKTATEKGSAIATIEGTAENIKALDEWQKTLVAKKLRLVSPFNE
jgi:polysaccharide deacetylase 2 family uncharacterized protein YibQ